MSDQLDVDAQAIVARIEADIALLRKVCIDPMSIKIAENIDMEVRPADEDDRVLVGRSGWGCTVVNYNAEGLILDVFGHEELEPIHTTSIHASDISEGTARPPRPGM